MRALLFVAATACANAVYGQVAQPSAELLRDGRIRIGADPENPIDRLNALRDHQVLNGLQMNASAVESLQQHLRDYERSFQDFLRKNRRKLTQEQFQELTDTLKDEAMVLLDEVLTPEQKKRLPQIL